LNTNKLCATLDYQYSDISRLEIALTHRSASSQNNERAEFLGDSILNFVIADQLFQLYPKATEGELSRQRARLVNKDSLAELARTLDLGSYLRLGSGELKSGGFRRDSILADTFEAVICSIYLDSNFDSARQFIIRVFDNRLNNLPAMDELKDPKTRLQELLQARKTPIPSYDILSVSGKQHAQIFEIECCIDTLNLKVAAVGQSRRKAEQAAAMKMLDQLAESKI